MFHFSDTLVILALLLLFMSSVHCLQESLSIRSGARVEHPYVKKCLLEPSSPEAICYNIQSRPVFYICLLVGHRFTGQALQVWLSGHPMTHLCEEGCCQISHFIVPDGGEPSSWAGQSVLDAELVSATAVRRQVLKWPTIPKRQSISKRRLVQSKTMAINWQC